MITLGPTDSLNAGATSPDTVNCVIEGQLVTAGSPPASASFGVLFSGQLGATVAEVYSPPSEALVSRVALYNTNPTSPQTVTWAENGTTSAHTTATFVLNGGWRAEYEQGSGWKVYDQNGTFQSGVAGANTVSIVSAPFDYTDPIGPGVPLYTPAVGDTLLESWIEVDAPFGGTTPTGAIVRIAPGQLPVPIASNVNVTQTSGGDPGYIGPSQASNAVGVFSTTYPVGVVITTTGGSSIIFVPADQAPALPLTVVSGINDEFVYTPLSTGIPETFTLAAGTYASLLECVSAMADSVGSAHGELFSTITTVNESALSGNPNGPDELLLIAGNLAAGDTVSFGSNDVAAALGFTGNPDIARPGGDDTGPGTRAMTGIQCQGSDGFAITVTANFNDQFLYTPISTGVAETFTIAPGVYSGANPQASNALVIAAMMAATGSISGEALSTKVLITQNGEGDIEPIYALTPGDASNNGDTLSSAPSHDFFGADGIASQVQGAPTPPLTFTFSGGIDPIFGSGVLKILIATPA